MVGLDNIVCEDNTFVADGQSRPAAEGHPGYCQPASGLKSDDMQGLAPQSNTSGRQSGFQQRNFVLSFFQAPKPTEANYRLVADANFTTLLQEGNINRSNAADSIRLAEHFGLDVIAQPFGESALNSSAVIGLYLRDDPPSTAFHTLASLVGEVRRKHPHLLSFINLRQSEPDGRARGGGTYADYLREFIGEVDPDILCFVRCAYSLGCLLVSDFTHISILNPEQLPLVR